MEFYPGIYASTSINIPNLGILADSRHLYLALVYLYCNHYLKDTALFPQFAIVIMLIQLLLDSLIFIYNLRELEFVKQTWTEQAWLWNPMSLCEKQ